MSVAALAASLAISVLPLPLSVADDETQSATMEKLPTSAYADSISQLETADVTPLADETVGLDKNVAELESNIVEIDQKTVEGVETVISLASDILFDSNKSEVPKRAKSVVGDLVSEIPNGAEVDVFGHTDSLDTDDYNQDLSERRAEAVADILEDARPDLELNVKGFGEMEPLEPNEKGGEDNPEGRAANRRVEIRYES